VRPVRVGFAFPAPRHHRTFTQTLGTRLGVGGRTLQRQLAEHNTTWRAELDAARHRVASRAGAVSMAALADRVGYADPRSARRAVRRWNAHGVRVWTQAPS
jgi:hypothetical protein